MARVVFDTNTLISAFVFGGTPESAYRLILTGKIILVTSAPIMYEFARILKLKFQWEDDKIQRALKQIVRISDIVKPGKTIKVIDDDPDNRILEAAVAGKADFIVSGDKHLLKLKEFHGVQIVNANELVSMAM